MNKILALLSCFIFVLGLAGCQKPAQTTPPISGIAPAPPRGGVEVIIEGGGEFPQFLAGTWKTDKHGWEFVFERDGTISSAVIDSSMIRVTPSKRVATRPLKDGSGKGVYELGQWTVQYSPDNRELAVEVVVEHYSLDMVSFGLEGHSTDWFVGPVSEDSQTWEAEWFTFRKTTAWGPETLEFPFDPNDNPVETLVFRKQPETN